MTTTPVRHLVIGNTHELVADPKKDGNKHRWAMFVKQSPADTSSAPNDQPLTQVIYHLHPSFKPNRIAKKASDENPDFSLGRVGWGSFVITVELHWADGQIDNVNHELQFEQPSDAYLFKFDVLKPVVAAPPTVAPTTATTTAPVATATTDDDAGMGEAQMSDPDPRPKSPLAAPSAPTPPPAETTPPVPPMSREEAASWHGYLMADADLPRPTCVTRSDDFSRPDYTKIKSAEFCDTPETLNAKADMLIKMWTSAEHPLVYAGAGISTSSGIWDYASNAKGSKVQPTKRKLTMAFIESLKPTPAHRVITAMEKKGHVWGWLQQNHDGLAQKAGFPGDKVNELHGAWLDQKNNPIIKMSGTLRDDLFNWCCEMEDKCDFVFAVGTSFSGLNSERCAASCAKRHMKKGAGQGLAIISIQRTPYDDVAGLRIFSRIDDFMLLVAKKMNLGVLDKKVYPYVAPRKPVGVPKEKDWQAERAKKLAKK